VVDLEDLGYLREALRRLDSARAIVRPHERVRDEGEANGMRVDSRRVPLDHSLLLELADALEDGRGRETNLPGDLGIRNPGILL
jgi:hypothetical protein